MNNNNIRYAHQGFLIRRSQVQILQGAPLTAIFPDIISKQLPVKTGRKSAMQSFKWQTFDKLFWRKI